MLPPLLHTKKIKKHFAIQFVILLSCSQNDFYVLVTTSLLELVAVPPHNFVLVPRGSQPAEEPKAKQSMPLFGNLITP